MRRLRFSEAIRFHDFVSDHLARHEAENCLVLGILANVLSGVYQDVDPYMTEVEEEG